MLSIYLRRKGLTDGRTKSSKTESWYGANSSRLLKKIPKKGKLENSIYTFLSK